MGVYIYIYTYTYIYIYIQVASAATPQLHPLQLLLLECINPLVIMRMYAVQSGYNKYKGHVITVLLPPPELPTSVTHRL